MCGRATGCVGVAERHRTAEDAKRCRRIKGHTGVRTSGPARTDPSHSHRLLAAQEGNQGM